jgi:Flp pilus assembly pilin Flp
MARLLAALTKWFVTRNEGATVVEYAVLLLLLAAVTFAAIVGLGHALSTAFNNVANSI